jgi:hypothetical protein
MNAREALTELDAAARLLQAIEEGEEASDEDIAKAAEQRYAAAWKAARVVLAQPEERADAPTLKSLRGIAKGALGGMSSEEFVERSRANWSQPEAQEGYASVPVEPTEAMVAAGALGICNDARGCEGQYADNDSVWATWRRDARHAYAAMIRAAQEPKE